MGNHLAHSLLARRRALDRHVSGYRWRHPLRSSANTVSIEWGSTIIAAGIILVVGSFASYALINNGCGCGVLGGMFLIALGCISWLLFFNEPLHGGILLGSAAFWACCGIGFYAIAPGIGFSWRLLQGPRTAADFHRLERDKERHR